MSPKCRSMGFMEEPLLLFQLGDAMYRDSDSALDGEDEDDVGIRDGIHKCCYNPYFTSLVLNLLEIKNRQTYKQSHSLRTPFRNLIVDKPLSVKQNLNSPYSKVKLPRE
jgi:hypothetical protein